MRHSRFSIHNPLHNYGKGTHAQALADATRSGNVDALVKAVYESKPNTDALLSSLSTVQLVALHNVLGGGAWLGQVRRALNLRVSFLPLADREAVRIAVGAFSWSVIYRENR